MANTLSLKDFEEPIKKSRGISIEDFIDPQPDSASHFDVPSDVPQTPLPPSTIPDNVRDWKVSPEEQAQRDAVARDARQWEVNTDQLDPTLHAFELAMDKQGSSKLPNQADKTPTTKTKEDLFSYFTDPEQKKTAEDLSNQFVDKPITDPEQVTNWDMFKSGLYDVAAATARGAGTLAAMPLEATGNRELANTVGQGGMNLAHKIEDENKHIPPEVYEKLPWSKKFVKALGALAPGMALSLVTKNPVPMMANMGMMAFSSQAAQVEQGLTPGVAAASAGLEASFNAASSVVAFTTASIIRAMGLRAITNSASGFITDSMNKIIKQNTGNEDFAKLYDPFDLTQRSIEAVLGGGMGVISKYAEMKSIKQQRESVENIFDNYVIPELRKQLDLFNQNTHVYNVKDYAHTQTLNPNKPNLGFHLLLEDLANGTYQDLDLNNNLTPQPYNNNEKAKIALQYIRDYDTDPALVKQAKYMMGLFEFFGQDNITGINLKLNPNLVENHGRWNWVTNTIDYSKITPDIFIHEMGHALAYHVIDQSTKILAITPTTPEGVALKDSANKYHELVTHIRNKILKDLEGKDRVAGINIAAWDQFKIDHDILNLYHTIRDQNLYGLIDTHEFTSELISKPNFRSLLSQYKPTAAEMNQYTTGYHGKPSGKDTFLNIFRDHSNGKTFLDLALVHAANIFDKTMRRGTAATEFQNSPTQRNTSILDQTSNIHNFLINTFNFGKDNNLGSLAKKLKQANAQISDEEFLGKHTAEFIMRRIGSIFNEGTNSEAEAHNKILALFFQNESYRQLIKDEFPSIMANADKFVTIYEDFKVHGDNRDKVTQDLRSMKEILTDITSKTRPSKHHDISSAGTLVVGKDYLAVIKDQNIGGDIVRAFVDKLNGHHRLKSQIHYIFMMYQKSFMELKTDKERINVMNEASYWDSPIGRMELKTLNQMWPTDGQLSRRGLTPEEVRAYRDLANGYDYIWESLDAAGKTIPHLNENGQVFQLVRIPGFMPHFHLGTVKVKYKITDINTGHFDVLMSGHDTIYGAKRYIEKIQANNNVPNPTHRWEVIPDYDTGKPYYTIKDRSARNAGLLPTLIDHYNSYATYTTLAPDIAKMVQDLDSVDIRGYNKSLLTRHNVGGYVNEYAFGKPMKSYFNFFLNKSARDAFALYERYATSAADFIGNAYFVKDVYAPLTLPVTPDSPEGYQRHLAEMPNLTTYIDAESRNFTGENKNIIKPLDEAFEKLAEKLQLHPHFFKFAVRGVRGLLSTVKLRTVRNWWANGQQPLNGLAMLETFAVGQGLKPLDPSGKRNNPFNSYIWAMDQLGGGMDKEGKFVLDYARNAHITEPMQDEQMGMVLRGRVTEKLDKAALGGINMSVEGFSRETTFLMSYHYMKQFYDSPIEALEAADRATRIIMVNYDRASRPLIYQETGMLGEAFSTFAIFRNAYLANTYLMIRTLARNPTKLDSYKPILLGQLVYLMQAGMLGLIGAAEYDMLANAYNDIADPEYPLPTLASFAVKHNLPDILVFGAATEASKYTPLLPNGAVMGASATAPNLANLITPPILPFVQALVAFGLVLPAKEVISWFTDNPGASSDDIYKYIRQLIPPSLEPVLNYAMGMPVNIGSRASNLEGMVDVDLGDIAAKIYTGSLSPNEWRNRRTEEILFKHETTMNSKVKGFVNKVADKMMGVPFGLSIEEAYQKAKKWDPSLEYDDFVDRINQEVTSRRTSKKTRDYSTGTANDIYKRQLERERYGLQ